MKNLNLLISGALLVSVILASCAPAVPPTEPTYPDDATGEPDQPLTTGEIKDVSGEQAYNTDPQATDEALVALAESNNAFALDLYQQLSTQEGNLFYSPYSIYQALLMTYAGAEGNTASQMESALHLPYTDNQIHEVMNALNLRLEANTLKSNKPGFTFNVSNALWGQQGYEFLPAFLNALSANYAAGLKTVDFNNPETARQLINLWVAAQTNDKIKDLIPQGVLNEMTRLVLTNAVYFKAAWLTQFDPASTAEGAFTLSDGSTTQVPMMHLTHALNASAEGNLKVVELPYEGGTYSMVVMMPEDGKLAEFEQSLTQEKLNGILSGLGYASVILTMPRFKVESSFSLADQMEQLGMTDAFNPDLADFSGMNGKKELYVSSLIHKAFANVNEEGTEAAAATAVVVGVTSAPAEQYTITLDKPFLFLIRDNATNTILFIGRVAHP
ncbi:MAG: serpin family protein [Anaerolineaceae bacterium]